MHNLSFELVAFLLPGAIGAIIRVMEGGRTPPRFGRISIVAITYGALLLLISNWPRIIDVFAGIPISPRDRIYATVGSLGLLGLSFFMLLGAYSFTGRIAGWLARDNKPTSEQDMGLDAE